MSLSTLGIGVFAGSVGALAARGYQATWEQACIFTSVDLAVNCVFYNYFMPCEFAGNSKQIAVLDLTCRIIGCLSGVLATRLVCEKTIEWRPAVIAHLASIESSSILAQFFYGDSDAMPLKV